MNTGTGFTSFKVIDQPYIEPRVYHIYSKSTSPNWYAWYYTADGKQKQVSTKLPVAKYSKAEARAIMNSRAGYIDYTVVGLEGYLLRKLNTDGASVSTIQHYTAAFKYLKDCFGTTFDARNFHKSDITTFKEYLRGKGFKFTTVNSYLRQIKQAFNTFVADEILEKNIFWKFGNIKPNSTELSDMQSKKWTLTEPEFHHFLDIVNRCKHEDKKHLVRLLALTGMRRSEVLKIRRSDVGETEFLSPDVKSRTGRMIKRKIYHEYIRHDLDYFLNKYPGEDCFNVCRPETVSHWGKGLLALAGYGDLHLHNIRHSILTILVEQGYNVRDVQHFAGHSKLSTTEIYLHDNEPGDIGIM